MRIIEELWKAIAGDPPKPHKPTADDDQLPGRPTVDDYCLVEQERLNLEMERDAYKRELLRLGYRPEMLLAMARANLTEVRAS